MKKEFVMRGQTASGLTEVLNFGKYKAGYAYRLTDFRIFPGGDLAGTSVEMVAALTAAPTAADPVAPDFEEDGLIGNVYLGLRSDAQGNGDNVQVINDTFLITQNLILIVRDVGGSNFPVNWQCRFESVKMTGPEEAATNYKQFAISDG